jgi:hypothetical protein
MKKIFGIFLFFIQIILANNVLIQTVDGQDGSVVGTVPTLHIFKDQIYILYGDETNYQLKLVKKENGNFKKIVTIDGTSDASNFAIDKNGNIHICYLKDEGIYYETNKTGNWVSTYVDKAYSSTWTRIGCDVDENGLVYISYDYHDINTDKFQLHYATNKSGSFKIETVYDDNCQYSSLVLGKNNIPYITFSNFSNVYFTYKEDNGTWFTPALVGGWLDNSITYDYINDEALIAYTDGGLYFAKTRDNMGISFYSVDTLCKASLPSISIGKKGVGIAYLCSQDNKKYVKVAMIDDKIKTVDDITPTENYWHGEYGVSIDFDNKGYWHIAYYDVKNKSLKYATNAVEDNDNTNGNNSNYILKIHKGWQNIGAKKDFDVKLFNNSCVDFVWKYDDSNLSKPFWRVYVANGKNYSISSTIKSLTFIKAGEGYWIKGNDNCKVKIGNIGNNLNDSHLIEEKDLINKNLELLHRNSSWQVDYFFKVLFNKDYTFTGVYNYNISQSYTSTSDIEENGTKISGTWKIINSKIYLYTNNEKIILTPILLEIENPVGFEIFKNGNYEKKILTIQNYY